MYGWMTYDKLYWDRKTSDKIEKILKYHGLYFTDKHQLCMKVRDASCQVTLSQIDLKRNFLAQFKDLDYYDFQDSNTVHIKFKDPIAAFYCQQFLDGEYAIAQNNRFSLDKHSEVPKARLIVKWIDYSKEEPNLNKRDKKALDKLEEEKDLKNQDNNKDHFTKASTFILSIP